MISRGVTISSAPAFESALSKNTLISAFLKNFA
jgi:hypothetical protein